MLTFINVVLAVIVLGGIVAMLSRGIAADKRHGEFIARRYRARRRARAASRAARPRV